MSKLKVAIFVGTRPEVIKMAPVILELRRHPEAFSFQVVATGQHRELLHQMLGYFEITPDVTLDVMLPNQELAGVTARLLPKLDRLVTDSRPDWVLAQGDTTTVLVTALACFYRHVRFAHVEAGLRTGDKRNPFPEEMNRVLASRLADVHFAPTRGAVQNLIGEGVPRDRVHLTGNTVVDALLHTCGHSRAAPQAGKDGRLLLVTAHRRESFGQPMEEICSALVDLTQRYADVQVLFPVHPNPNVREVAERILRPCPRVRLAEPLDYLQFVAAMQSATLILTDSGGVQEEAPSLGKPVLLLRDATERPEAVQAGAVRVVGPHRQQIVSEASCLLDDAAAYAAMANVPNPFGDGRAAQRIVSCLAGWPFSELGPASFSTAMTGAARVEPAGVA